MIRTKIIEILIRNFSKSRPEQKNLRKYLINNKEHNCIICDKHLPLCLLEAAHLKPRCLCKSVERLDKNNVELMCNYCHHLYDNALLGVKESNLMISNIVKSYDLCYERKYIKAYNELNKRYFDYHFENIFKNKNK